MRVEPSQSYASEMAPLKNIRHEAFAQAIVAAPRTGMNNRQCYFAAGYESTNEAADASCARLLGSARIKTRIAELQAPAIRASRITLQTLLAELQLTVEQARQAKQLSAVNGALALIAKLTGLLTERIEVTERGPFAHCTSVDQVIDLLVDDAGSAALALSDLDQLRDLLAERAARGALPIPSAAGLRGQRAEA